MSITDLRQGNPNSPNVSTPGSVATSAAAVWIVEEIILGAPEIGSGTYTLTSTPAFADRVRLGVINGLGEYDYAIDYAMVGATAVITWAGLNLDGLLEIGDTIKITYTTLSP